MSMAMKVEKALSLIKSELLSDKDIRKLLYYSTSDALSKEAPSISDVENKIITGNYVDRTKDEGKSAFILVFSPGWNTEGNVSDITFQIGAYTWPDNNDLDFNRLRHLAFLHRIETVLEGKKLDFAGNLTMEAANIESVDNGETLGYSTTWGVSDSSENTRGF